MMDFTGWIPIRVFWRDGCPRVDWGYLGTRRFTEPFFNQTTQVCVRHAADVLFRPETPLESLTELVSKLPTVPPAGFIFHMSRCGSTLISQMLAAVPQNVVLSEPGPVDDVLRAHYRDPEISDEDRARWLRAMVGALGQCRNPDERRLFIKFDSWHVLLLPVIRRAFPEVPCIFLYRDPVEVMASAQKQLGGQMIPGVLPAEMFGWTPEMVQGMSLYEYTARVLARFCEQGLESAHAGQLKLVNYCQLPADIWPELLRHWGVACPGADMDRMLNASRADAKNPVLGFASDSQEKRESLSPKLRQLAQRWIQPVYEELERERQRTGFS